MWGVTTPAEAKAKIAAQVKEAGVKEPKNLEEQALSMVGRDIYLKLVKEYTEKQWGRDCKLLPPFIIKRLPLRFVYDNNYFTDRYQGIPVGGYTGIIEKLLHGVEVRLDCDFNKDRNALSALAEKVVYTGAIDELFDCVLGRLEYRSLKFETEILDTDNFQGNAVVNYTSRDVPYTRIIEHKHFVGGTQPKTVITREYPKPTRRATSSIIPSTTKKTKRLPKGTRRLRGIRVISSAADLAIISTTIWIKS